MPSTFNVAGTFQVPSATESSVFADGTRSVPATIGRKVDGIGHSPRFETSGAIAAPLFRLFIRHIQSLFFYYQRTFANLRVNRTDVLA